MRYWMNQGTTMCFNNIEKDVEYCSKFGFESIELKYNLIRRLDWSWINDMLQSNNIYAGSIGAIQLPVMQNKEVKFCMEKKLNDICKCANKLHAEYIVAVPSRGVEDITWHFIEEDALKILKCFADIAESYHVKIAMEITGFADSAINTLDKGLKLIHMADKENLGIIYDLYHVLGMGDLGQKDVISDPNDIFIVHINDGIKCDMGIYRDDDRLWPGDGEINIEKEIGMLKRINYQGPFSIEVYQRQSWPCNMQECYKMAHRRMKKIEWLASM